MSRYVISDRFKNRFIKSIIKTDSCWFLPNKPAVTGYIQVTVFYAGKRYNTNAHRVSYQIFKGEILNNLHVCHSCDVRNCINPNHLWLGTVQQNLEDRKIKGRNAAGENHGNSKLTANDVNNIRNSYFNKTMSVINLCKYYSLGKSTVYDIISGKSWRV